MLVVCRRQPALSMLAATPQTHVPWWNYRPAKRLLSKQKRNGSGFPTRPGRPIPIACQLWGFFGESFFRPPDSSLIITYKGGVFLVSRQGFSRPTAGRVEVSRADAEYRTLSPGHIPVFLFSRFALIRVLRCGFADFCGRNSLLSNELSLSNSSRRGPRSAPFRFDERPVADCPAAAAEETELGTSGLVSRP